MLLSQKNREQNRTSSARSALLCWRHEAFQQTDVLEFADGPPAPVQQRKVDEILSAPNLVLILAGARLPARIQIPRERASRRLRSLGLPAAFLERRANCEEHTRHVHDTSPNGTEDDDAFGLQPRRSQGGAVGEASCMAKRERPRRVFGP